MDTTLHKAADQAAKYLHSGLGGLAIHKAAQDYGRTTKQIAAELMRRRKANNHPVKHWQETCQEVD